MSAHRMIGHHFYVPAIALLALTAQAAEPTSTRLEIWGDYRYKIQASEQAADAKDLACRRRSARLSRTRPFTGSTRHR